MIFRKLREDEIDCRVALIKESGLSLLLYKDARVDMKILDETVGAERWTREHTLINGNLFCSVGIFIPDLNQWVFKQDVGVESNTEKEKGQASDSFKRACFNWGIGRELYSAPFIWIPSDCYESYSKNGKTQCKDSFAVKEISYTEGGDIDHLVIVNTSSNRVVFSRGGKPKKNEREEIITAILIMAEQKGYTLAGEGLETAPIERLKVTLRQLEAAPKKGEIL